MSWITAWIDFRKLFAPSTIAVVQFFHTLLIVSSDNPDKSNLPHSFVDRRPHILGATPLRALQESMTQMFGVGAERVLRDLRVGVTRARACPVWRRRGGDGRGSSIAL